MPWDIERSVVSASTWGGATHPHNLWRRDGPKSSQRVTLRVQWYSPGAQLYFTFTEEPKNRMGRFSRAKPLRRVKNTQCTFHLLPYTITYVPTCSKKAWATLAGIARSFPSRCIVGSSLLSDLYTLTSQVLPTDFRRRKSLFGHLLSFRVFRHSSVTS